MSDSSEVVGAVAPDSWRARGVILENCSCTLVCPGHMHFSQPCTHDRCKGYWALRFDDGHYASVPLAGLKALIAFDSPQRMIDGGWIQSLVIDRRASEEQRLALERILTGKAGGPWAKLAAFVGTQRPAEFLDIEIREEGAERRVSIAGRLTSVIRQIRGRDRTQPVVFENIFNQIHGARQILALGESTYGDGTVLFVTAGTHGLISRFDWAVEGEG